MRLCSSGPMSNDAFYPFARHQPAIFPDHDGFIWRFLPGLLSLVVRNHFVITFEPCKSAITFLSMTW